MRKYLCALLLLSGAGLSRAQMPCSGPPNVAAVTPTSQIICKNANGTLSLTPAYTESGMSFQWQKSNSSTGPYVNIPNTNMQSIYTGTLSSQTWFRVIVTCTITSHSTTSDSAIVKFSNCTGIDEVWAGEISIYPVPASDVLFVEGTGFSDLVVTGIDGRHYPCRTSNTGETVSFDVSALDSGIYFLSNHKNGLIKRRFVILH